MIDEYPRRLAEEARRNSDAAAEWFRWCQRHGQLERWLTWARSAFMLQNTSILIDEHHVRFQGNFLSLHWSPEVRDLSPLVALQRLKTLHLRKSPNIDLSPLQYLVQLRELCITDTNVSDIRPLASLTNLEDLRLDRTLVADLGALRDLENINNLTLHHTHVRDLAPLSNIPYPLNLELDHVDISDISSLASVKGLYRVSLSHTPVFDVRPLLELPHLTAVNLDHSGVIDFEPLLEIPTLQRLGLRGIELSPAQCNALRRWNGQEYHEKNDQYLATTREKVALLAMENQKPKLPNTSPPKKSSTIGPRKCRWDGEEW